MAASKSNRVSSTRLDGRLFLSETMYNQEISQSLSEQVHQLGNTGLPKKPDRVATLHRCIKPLWVAMRLLGFFPICYTATGTAYFKKMSGSFNYAVLAFVFMGGCTALVTLYRISFLRNSNGNFNELIFSYMCIFYSSAYWFIHIGHWIGAGRVASYVNNWTNFQDRCQKLTEVPLSFNIRRQVLFWAVSIPLLAITLLIFEFILLRAFDYWEAVYYIYINCMIFYHYTLWYYVCLAFSQASSYLKTMLNKDLRAHASDQGVVPKYRALWEELSSLTRDTGDVLCITYGSLLIFWFTILTFCTYSFVSDSVYSNIALKEIGLGLNCLLVFGLMFLLCNSAHQATDAVGRGLLPHIKQLKSQNAIVQRQLELFQLATFIDPPCISLGGFVSINRGLLISLLATIVTYIVVLLQFKAGTETTQVCNASLATPP